MKRAGRWLFNFAAAVSAVMCVGVAVLWVLSWWRTDQLRRLSFDGPMSSPQRAREFRLVSADGGMALLALTVSPLNQAEATKWSTAPRGTSTLHRPARANPPHWYWQLWFQYETGQASPGPTLFEGVLSTISGSRTYAPYWFFVLCSGGMPALWLASRMKFRRMRLKAGLCADCGYDLRATPDRCPECGAIPESAKEAAT